VRRKKNQPQWLGNPRVSDQNSPRLGPRTSLRPLPPSRGEAASSNDEALGSGPSPSNGGVQVQVLSSALVRANRTTCVYTLFRQNSARERRPSPHRLGVFVAPNSRLAGSSPSRQPLGLGGGYPHPSSATLTPPVRQKSVGLASCDGCATLASLVNE
jgi:hypothetical protein